MNILPKQFKKIMNNKFEILSGSRRSGTSFLLNELKKYHEYEKEKVPLKDRTYYGNLIKDDEKFIKAYESKLLNYEKRQIEFMQSLIEAKKSMIKDVFFEEGMCYEK